MAWTLWDSITEFLSPEAGQRRRQWLNEKEQGFREGLYYALGPQLAPTVENAAGLLNFTDAGDMPEAARASRDLWSNPSVDSAINYATAAGAMAIPFVSARMMDEGIDVAGDAWRSLRQDTGNFVTDESGAIRAFHGSPHDFDEFRMDRIGTGEGAQAYGHGLYFAENEDVAQFYRDNYAKPDRGRFSTDTARQMAQDQLQAWAGDVQGGIDDLKSSLRNMETTSKFFGATAEDTARMQDLREAISYMEAGAPRGRMYEVNINANPEDFLDWDKPLSEQSANVREALKGLVDPVRGDLAIRDMVETVEAATGDPNLSHILENKELNMTGDQIVRAVRSAYDRAGSTANTNAMAAQELAYDAKIPGIRYKDQMSRGAEGGTSNYVVFDEKLIEILRKYGLAGAMMGGLGAMQSQPEGLLSDGS